MSHERLAMTPSTTRPETMLPRVAVAAYGLVAYVCFLGTLAYALGFIANAVVPKGIDDGPEIAPAIAVLIDSALVGLFAVQHSVMARASFKRWSRRLVPAELARSTYVLASSAVLAALLWQWRPLPGIVWSVEAGWAAAVLWALKGVGIVTVMASTFAAGHLKMFGLRQTVFRRPSHPEATGFRRPGLYWVVRHPIMVGFLIAFWAAPQATVGRLLFNVLASGYILLAVRFQERDLRAHFGEPYEQYLRQVPRFVPRPRRVPR